jgi:hypothetical protein
MKETKTFRKIAKHRNLLRIETSGLKAACVSAISMLSELQKVGIKPSWIFLQTLSLSLKIQDMVTQLTQL